VRFAAEEQDFEKAKAYYEHAISRVREVNYPAPGSLCNLANIALAEGDYDRARELSSQAASIFRERNNELGVATALLSLSRAALYGGRLDEARSFLRESLALCVDLRYSVLGVSCLHASAAILARADRHRDAASLLGAGEKLLDEMRSTLDATERPMQEETRALIRDALQEGETAVAWESGRALSLEGALSFALAALD
jgi:tetratricopeptide (TPR) repeat protein